ncbi:hypothetical protein LRS06_14220 [Hymenobacter sp. J193]|uniref:hypothetical protein n=1 Tax=Hymenobacter sp. J193 TaxID=2898429 RepID=UPI0021509985|nr:hypothetical protein [Hymenobacter sp. J193]MCR5888901.1 hypothetical protein [Hymenobacter sp. J193]
MNFEKLTKAELIKVLEAISQVIESPSAQKSQKEEFFWDGHIKNRAIIKRSNRYIAEDIDSDLSNLIGVIPFFLLNENIFQKNQDLSDFAKRLDIQVPFAGKRGKEEIVGRIISQIARFDIIKLKQLNAIMDQLTFNPPKEDKNSFFSAWDDIISNMKL